MCVGSITTYSRCGHTKVQNESHCPDGLNVLGLCSTGNFRVAWQKRSDAPSLCVNCYRRYVDDVIAQHKRKIQLVDDRIDSLTWSMRAAATNEMREGMKAQRSALEVQRGELIDSRYAKLEDFRIAQGVWGDA